VEHPIATLIENGRILHGLFIGLFV
jgi:hypothetical protein